MSQLHLWPLCKTCGHSRVQHFNTLDERKAGGCQARTKTYYASRTVNWICACALYKPDGDSPKKEAVSKEESVTDQRPMTHTTLDVRRNQQTCQNVNCGHARGDHYGNMPYTSPSGRVSHCSRCAQGTNVCGGFRGEGKQELPIFEAYFGKMGAEWPLRLWEHEGHAISFLRNKNHSRLWRVRVEAISELELVERAEYLAEKSS